MTRYSASRGIRYSAPPGPNGDRTDETATETDAAETPLDAEADPDGDAGRGAIAADDD